MTDECPVCHKGAIVTQARLGAAGGPEMDFATMYEQGGCSNCDRRFQRTPEGEWMEMPPRD